MFNGIIKSTGIINKMKDSLNVAIAGATGYVGIELIKILSKHPHVKITHLCATKSIGKSINNFDRNKYHYSNLCFGMSIKAAINIMKEKNFYFVGTNLLRNNAFFISNRFKKDVFFKNLEINDLSSSVNATFSESRNKNKELNYLKYNERLEEILNCDIVDLKDGKNEIVKLEKLINLN